MPTKGELTEQNTQGADKGQNDFTAVMTFGDREIPLKSPGSGSLAMFTAAFAKRKGQDQIARLLDFLDSRIEDEGDKEWFENALLNDDISLEDVMEELEKAMELWSEDPTLGSSGSSSRSTGTGKRSTGASRRVQG